MPQRGASTLPDPLKGGLRRGVEIHFVSKGVLHTWECRFELSTNQRGLYDGLDTAP